jgi:hypothetical protein
MKINKKFLNINNNIAMKIKTKFNNIIMKKLFAIFVVVKVQELILLDIKNHKNAKRFIILKTKLISKI